MGGRRISVIILGIILLMSNLVFGISNNFSLPDVSAQSIPTVVEDYLRTIQLKNSVTGDVLESPIILQPEFVVSGIRDQFVTTLALEDRLGRAESDEDNADIILKINYDKDSVISTKIVQLGGDRIQQFIDGTDSGLLPNAREVPVTESISSEVKENAQNVVAGPPVHPVVQDFLNNQLDLYNQQSKKYLDNFMVFKDAIDDRYASEVLGIDGQLITILGFEDLSESMLVTDYADTLY